MFTFDFECLLELVFGAFIFASRSENESPDNPVVCVLRLLLYTFPDLLDGFHDISFFKLSESPVHVSVVSVPIELLRLAADIERLFVNHMHVEEESQIVVGVGMRVVDQYASLEMLYSL